MSGVPKDLEDARAAFAAHRQAMFEAADVIAEHDPVEAGTRLAMTANRIRDKIPRSGEIAVAIKRGIDMATPEGVYQNAVRIYRYNGFENKNKDKEAALRTISRIAKETPEIILADPESFGLLQSIANRGLNIRNTLNVLLLFEVVADLMPVLFKRSKKYGAWRNVRQFLSAVSEQTGRYNLGDDTAEKAEVLLSQIDANVSHTRPSKYASKAVQAAVVGGVVVEQADDSAPPHEDSEETVEPTGDSEANASVDVSVMGQATGGGDKAGDKTVAVETTGDTLNPVPVKPPAPKRELRRRRQMPASPPMVVIKTEEPPPSAAHFDYASKCATARDLCRSFLALSDGPERSGQVAQAGKILDEVHEAVKAAPATIDNASRELLGRLLGAREPAIVGTVRKIVLLADDAKPS